MNDITSFVSTKKRSHDLFNDVEYLKYSFDSVDDLTSNKGYTYQYLDHWTRVCIMQININGNRAYIAPMKGEEVFDSLNEAELALFLHLSEW